jgi:hypothetical protein
VSAINGDSVERAAARPGESVVADFLDHGQKIPRSRVRGAGTELLESARFPGRTSRRRLKGEGRGFKCCAKFAQWVDCFRDGSRSQPCSAVIVDAEGGCRPVVVRAEGAATIARAPRRRRLQERRWERCEGLRTRKTMGYCDFADGYSGGHCVRTLDDFIERSTSA